MKVVAARARVDLHRTKDIVLGDDSGGTGILLILAPVAQLDRASDYGSEGLGVRLPPGAPLLSTPLPPRDAGDCTAARPYQDGISKPCSLTGYETKPVEAPKIMTDSPEISAVLPCFNEEDNIEPLIQQLTVALAPLGRSYELVFVDDASTDGTASRLRALTATTPTLRVLRHRRNFGQSAAIMSGYEASRGQYVLTMDSDLQNDPADIPRLIERLDAGADCVCGIRTKRHDSWTKKVSSKIANGVRNWALADGIHDAGCTMRGVRRDALRQLIGFRALHRFLPTILKLHGYRVDEIEVNHRARMYGQSKYGTMDRLFVGISDIRGMRWYGRRFFPPNRLEQEQEPAAISEPRL